MSSSSQGALSLQEALESANKLVVDVIASEDPDLKMALCSYVDKIFLRINISALSALNPQTCTGDRDVCSEFAAVLYRQAELWSELDQFDRAQMCSDTAQLWLDFKGDYSTTTWQSILQSHVGSDLHQLYHPWSNSLANHANLDTELQNMKQHRLQQLASEIYIPPQAKANLQAPHTALFPLMENMREFLASNRQVFLLLGASGAGKSTFNRHLESHLWNKYEDGGSIPLHISLPAIEDPDVDMVAKQLRRLSFSDSQVQELKRRRFVLICDGYDKAQLTTNLHSTNRLNQAGEWSTKMVISCRSECIGPNYRTQFRPQTTNLSTVVAGNLFQEAVIAPFSKSQIEDYIDQYVSSRQSSFSTKNYMDRIAGIPNLMELVTNPFLLTLALETLMTSKELNLDKPITRVMLYDNFVEQWMEINKQRLEDSPLSKEDQSAFDMLLDDVFMRCGINYLKKLSDAIFSEQAGNPVVYFSHSKDNHTWKSAFFGSEPIIRLLRESCPLMRIGNHYRFIHRSLLEYFYSRTIYDPLDYHPDTAVDERLEATLKASLGQRSMVDESSVLEFLADRVEQGRPFSRQLFDIVMQSKTDTQVQASLAAANAISILVKAQVQFNCMDLRGIKIPGADLRGGYFDTTIFDGADLRDVNLGKTWLRQANLSKTLMSGVRFGELPSIIADGPVLRCVFSFDGGLLAVLSSRSRSKITIYYTATWTKIISYSGENSIAISPANGELAKDGQNNTVELCDILTGDPRLVLIGHDDTVTCISYSPDGTQIAAASEDTTIRIWSTLSGDTMHVLTGHTEAARGAVFSPNGLQIASISEDKTVRTWDTQTGDLLLILEGHNSIVFSVAYSPDGSQLASGDGIAAMSLAYSPNGAQLVSCEFEGSVRLWDPYNGESLNHLSGHLAGAVSVVYSPTGDYIASGGFDGAVRFWKAEETLSDAFSDIYRDQTSCIKFSPNGENIAAGRNDGGVYVLETLTGRLKAILVGHTRFVADVSFSPCGRYLASASIDCTMRLWCARTGATLHVFEGHPQSVSSLAFSPSGHQIVTGSYDKTVRIWDVDSELPELVLEGHTSEVNGVAYSPSGHQVASCSDDETVRLWCARTGEQLFVLNHVAKVLQAVYSPDGQYLASVSIADGDLRCWDPQSGERIDRLKTANYPIICCSFLPDSKLIATTNSAGVLRLWDLTSGHCLKDYRMMAGLMFQVRWMQRPDFMYLATLHKGGLHMWKQRETRDFSILQLHWSLGTCELNLVNTTIDDVVELSTVNLELMKQRGAIVSTNEPTVEE